MMGIDAKILDCTEAEYHADPCDVPSLSASAATTIVTRSARHCYAEHPRLGGQPRPDTDATQAGSALHSLIFGGAPVLRLDYENWRTEEARDKRREAHERGELPFLEHELVPIDAMAEAARAELERAEIDLDDGDSEATILWQDRGVQCRSRLDWLLVRDGRAMIIDLKSARNGSEYAMAKATWDRGYDIAQHAYSRAVQELYPGVLEVEFQFLVVEKVPPWCTYMAPPGQVTRQIGESRWDTALEIWDRCLRTGDWPGYRPGHVGLPPWAINSWLATECAISDQGSRNAEDLTDDESEAYDWLF
jgi:hypothetical protein